MLAGDHPPLQAGELRVPTDTAFTPGLSQFPDVISPRTVIY